MAKKEAKKEKADGGVSALKARLKDTEDQLLYLRAEFENFQKIQAREREKMVEQVALQVFGSFLPIFDDIQAEGERGEEGGGLMYKKVLKIGDEYGLVPIETKGERFDHEFHVAVSRKSSDKPEGVILEEVQRGYMLGRTVLRHAHVIVSGGTKEGSS